MVIEVGLLGEKPDVGFDLGIVKRFAQEACGSSGWKYQAHEQLQGGGFARAVGPKKAKDLALFNRQSELAESDFRAFAPESDGVAFFQIENFNRSHGSMLVYAKPPERNFSVGWGGVIRCHNYKQIHISEGVAADKECYERKAIRERPGIPVIKM